MSKKNERAFDPRGDRCPICRSWFRYGCGHTVQQALEMIEKNRIKKIIESMTKNPA